MVRYMVGSFSYSAAHWGGSPEVLNGGIDQFCRSDNASRASLASNGFFRTLTAFNMFWNLWKDVRCFHVKGVWQESTMHVLLSRHDSRHFLIYTQLVKLRSLIRQTPS